MINHYNAIAATAATLEAVMPPSMWDMQGVFWINSESPIIIIIIIIIVVVVVKYSIN